MYALASASAPAPEVDLWQALADPTRRALIDRLADGPSTTGALCDGFSMSRFGVMKHLGILERAGLVASRKQGRMRINHLNVAPLLALQSRWLSPRASRLGAAMESFTNRAEETQMPQSPDQLNSVDIALDWEVRAPVQRVWKLLFQRPQDWWPSDYRAGPEGSAMVLEERVGGSLREERPDGGGLLWYSVIALDPMRSLDLSGHLASRYGGPATSLLHLELSPGRDEGTTGLKLTDSAFGKLGPGFKASASEGWQAIFGGGLKALAEAA
jgi:DNA-binding transcriptional ArsR family regulator